MESEQLARYGFITLGLQTSKTEKELWELFGWSNQGG